MQTRLPALLVAIFVLAPPAPADDGHALPLWQVNGTRNRVYLLGSIHLLREQDHPLPAAIYAAYDDAESLVMELDMDDMDPVEGQVLTNELGLIKDGRELKDLMGSDHYAEAEQLAVAAQVPLALLANAEPWFAAMNVEIMLLMRMGFNPALGVDTHFAELAKADDKEIAGLESLRQQLEFLDGLSARAQRDMLLQALAEGADLQESMDDVIDAWKNGDVAYLEKNLLAEMEDYAELNQVIVVDRNLAWSDRIEAMLEDGDDYLVVVGTLHLVGDDGLPNLLKSRGYDVVQLRAQ
ncbi:MAG: TraB/GumN family protein [Gammaproteobacteria bacterium]|nr:TraB/GumN family protein [Gammaproteobacteria bacterium]MDH5346080.1 TraB/GumN family protein [Gammaproteobacteria bacterium]